MLRGLPTRKNNRLQGYNYSQVGYYFITICTKDGHKFFGSIDVGAATCRPFVRLTDIGKIIGESVENINTIYPNVVVDKYVVMPNHIHMLLCVAGLENGRQVASPTAVSTIVGNMKRYVSMQCGFSVWQPSYQDHIIRNEPDYQRIWQYIDENPLKWQEDCYFISEEKG